MTTLTADSLAASTDSSAPTSFTLRIDQRIALSSLHSHFVKRDARRGRYISACGTGKTVVMTRLPQILAAKTVVVLVPSLNLVSQTWDAFTRQLGDDGFRGFIVCSDDARAKRNDERETEDRLSQESPADFSEDELATQHHGAVLREAHEIAAALDSMTGLSIVFSTYQSAHFLLAGVLASEAQDVDLAICDEAHFLATADSAKARDKTHPANIVLKQLPAKRMVFATATPVEHEGRGVFSMDNKRLFGGVAHEYSYPEAREDGVVAPFDIVLCSFDEEQDQSEWLTQMRRQFELENASMDVRSTISHEQVRGLAVAHTLGDLIREGRVKRALTYSSTIDRTEQIADDLNRVIGDGTAVALSSRNNTAQRQAGILKLDAGDVNVIANCKLFTEGYDAPALDAIAFIDPKQSIVDIVQAIGRACRIPYGATNKRALVIVPIHEYETEQGKTIVTDKSGKTKIDKKEVEAAKKNGSKFAMLEAVLAAMTSPGLKLYDSAIAVRADLSGEQRRAPQQAFRSHWGEDEYIDDQPDIDVTTDTAEAGSDTSSTDGESPAPDEHEEPPVVGMPEEELAALLGGSRAELLRHAARSERAVQPDDVRILISEPLTGRSETREFEFEGRDELIASFVHAKKVKSDSIKYDTGYRNRNFEEHMVSIEGMNEIVANVRSDVKLWRTVTLLRSPQGRKDLLDQMPKGVVTEGLINGKLCFLHIDKSVLSDITSRGLPLDRQIKAVQGAAIVANNALSGESAIKYVAKTAPPLAARQCDKAELETQTEFERAAYEYAGLTF